MEKLLSTEWKKVAFANYIVPPEVVEKYLPKYTKIDFFNGNCFVSLVGYRYTKLKIADVKVPLIPDFEEIDLRFYVKRFDGAIWRKGTVAISRILKAPGLDKLGNALFQENLASMPTSGELTETDNELDVKYSWQFENDWKYLRVKSSKLATPFQENSETEFLLSRPFVYQQFGDDHTQEIELKHSSWHTYPVQEYSIDVDFSKQFDPVFSILNTTTPHSVILAEGSTVEINAGHKVSS